MIILSAFLGVLTIGISFAIRELLENSRWVAEVLIGAAANHLPPTRRDVAIAEWQAELEFIRLRRSKLLVLLWAGQLYCRSWRQGEILRAGDDGVDLISTIPVVRQISHLHLKTMEALALAIDAKDQTAQSHIRRVQVYAAGIARALGMPEHEIQGVEAAALLHDIGKLAVPEHILSKPGPLTQEESRRSGSTRRSAPKSSAACRFRILSPR